MRNVVCVAVAWIALFGEAGCDKRRAEETRTVATQSTVDAADARLESPPETFEDASGPEEAAVEPLRTNVVAYEKDGFVWLVDPDGKNNERLAEGHLINWSSDGQSFFYFTHRNNVVEIRRLDLSSGGTTAIRTVYDTPPDVRRITRKLLTENGRLRFSSFSGCFDWWMAKGTETDSSVSQGEPEQSYLCTGGVGNGVPFFDCACPAFSSDGKSVALDLWTPEGEGGWRGKWSISLSRFDTGETTTLTMGDTPNFSSDGRVVFFHEAGHRKRVGKLSVLRLDGSGRQAIGRGYFLFSLPGGDGNVYYAEEPVPGSGGCGGGGGGSGGSSVSGACWPGSWRGRLLAFSQIEEGRRFFDGWVDVSCGVPSDGNPLMQPAALSPQGDRVAFIGARADGCHTYLAFLNLATGEVTKVQDSEYAFTSIRPKTWAPDGSKIMITWIRGARVETRIVGADSQTAVMTLRDASVWFSSWSPDSRYLVYEYEGSLFLADIEAKNTALLVEGENPVWSPAQ